MFLFRKEKKHNSSGCLLAQKVGVSKIQRHGRLMKIMNREQ
jgi:hypothetical protein